MVAQSGPDPVARAIPLRAIGAEEQALLTEGYRPGLERLGYSL